ncbi:MAG TPA: hypothetical protein H9830_05655 [Candidatus Agrococcus pullicola]|uniref:Uncharacterized protein n=1 Tax=Candidatus Agrococcus pullicola TaxID=2838429 RepID=A0A9D2C852_9MICO|nr:hypothetical protein [Candidatus Agrococcus pullicola]
MTGRHPAGAQQGHQRLVTNPLLPPGSQPQRSGPNTDAKRSVWFAFSLVALIWMVIAFFGGIGAVLYLGLGVIMTNTLDGVFGAGPNYAFNWMILWTAIIGQVLGLLLSALVAVLALADTRKRKRLAKAGMIMGFIAAGGFLVTGLIQIPLWGILFDALAL